MSITVYARIKQQVERNKERLPHVKHGSKRWLKRLVDLLRPDERLHKAVFHKLIATQDGERTPKLKEVWRTIKELAQKEDQRRMPDLLVLRLPKAKGNAKSCTICKARGLPAYVFNSHRTSECKNAGDTPRIHKRDTRRDNNRQGGPRHDNRRTDRDRGRGRSSGRGLTSRNFSFLKSA